MANNESDFENPQVKYQLTITADSITSTDPSFTLDDLGLGDGCVPLEVYFVRSDGQKIERNREKGERRISNQTMPRLACQVFEKQIAALPKAERESFPVCKYNPDMDWIRGIYGSVDEFHQGTQRNSIEYSRYTTQDGKEFVIYSWNIFTTIFFVQECLKRFGDPGDRMILVYRRKGSRRIQEEKQKIAVQQDVERKIRSFNNPYSKLVVDSKNVIFRGAPGTGKSYLAKQIAADIVSGGFYDDYTELTDEQRTRVGFVQFHPSYDYTDFVEGLRPSLNDDGTMGFELQDGIFKEFIGRARKNYEDSRKSEETIKRDISAKEQLKSFVFIIDEINRGEISKIFGELFFAIDPDYRGPAGEVSTQYANLHVDSAERFFIPENVYIIGTMNDIDRSVDTFDFAMRRRFRFVELKADECVAMLDMLDDELREEAIARMDSLNRSISDTDELNDDYHIGPAYFLKLKDIGFDELWTDHLEPLLHDYIRGIYDEEGIMNRFAEAYGYSAEH